MSNVWFSSDFHYGHTNIAGPKVSRWKSGYRDFDSVFHMNEAIIDSINDNVGKHDTLYFLGDWAFGKEDNIRELRYLLNVQEIVLIYGNHDDTIRKNVKYHGLFTERYDQLHRSFGDTKIVMNHYPIAEWRDCHRGAIHLFGHVHGSREVGGKSMDVGWCMHRRPLSLDEILEKMSEKEVLQHH